MDQNAQSHRAVGDDEVVCNVHHIHKNGRSCSGAILAQAPCLCVNGVETMVGARAATKPLGQFLEKRRLLDPCLVWSCLLHVAFSYMKCKENQRPRCWLW